MLELGTIIYLKQGNKKLMVIGRNQAIKKDKEEIFFDYVACAYPEGIHPEETFFFNEENIDRVVFKGYVDEEEHRYQELVTNWKKEHGVHYYHIVNEGEERV
ncbi:MULTISPECIES: DUF4176 domain-containing protein [Listeria]|uniref:DUF4176 domain-containing protein n=1 Tax=Listeria TaxID=1637 RepID=UPI000B587A5B|nr:MULTISPECIES: DUF4176 domain-containing protein [Listeria]